MNRETPKGRSPWSTLPVGTRVRVSLVDEPGSDERGAILRREHLVVDGEQWNDNYLIIRLDDGREVSDLECWWIPDWEGE